MRVPSKASSIKSSLMGCSKGRSGLRESFKERIVEIQSRLCGKGLSKPNKETAINFRLGEQVQE